MKNGFTLVELSIVLVIIGLLAGGILVGQSMIESAKINSAVSKLKQYEVAIDQFKLKFKSIPGDSPYFVPAGSHGDLNTFNSGTSDNQITDNSGCFTSGPRAGYSAWEAFQIWPHLSQAGMITEKFPAWNPTSGAGTGCSGSGIHPASFVDIGGLITPVLFESEHWGGSSIATKKIPTFYRESQWTKPYFGFSAEPYDIISFDVKIDDGDNGTGNYLAGNRATGDITTGTLQLPSCTSYIAGGGNPEVLCESRWYFKGIN